MYVWGALAAAGSEEDHAGGMFSRTRNDHIGCSRLFGWANHSSVGDQQVAPVENCLRLVLNLHGPGWHKVLQRQLGGVCDFVVSHSAGSARWSMERAQRSLI